MKILSIILGFVLIPLFLSSCGGGGSSSNSDDLDQTYSMTGSAQKGPLIFGSNIWVSVLDTNLNPTGTTYISQTTDDLGNFTISTGIQGNLVEIVADGYFLNEISGGLSSGKLTLRAVADLSVDSSPTVNILTTIQSPRIKELMKTTSYSVALSQSQTEILTMFGITSSTVANLNGLFNMQIDGSSDPDSVLLATSAIIMQMATTEAVSNSTSKVAELSYFVSQIGSDISTDGDLDTTSIATKLNNAAKDVNLSSVRSNVETYYQNRGVSITAPKFEEWIDKDDSGYIPRRLIASTSQTFTNQTNLNLSSVVNSNEVSVAIGTGLRVPVYADSSSWTIVKNGSAVTGQYTTATNTDTLRVRATTPSSGGQTISVNLSIGSDTLGFSATTRDTVVALWEGSTTSCVSQDSTTDNKYFAIPFTTDTQDFASNSTYDVSYMALGVKQSGPGSGPKTPTTVTIQTDSSGVPSGTVAATGTLGSYGLDSGTYVVDGNGNQFPSNSRLPLQFFLSNPGTTLNQNTNYWVVLEYSASTLVHVYECGHSQSSSPIFSNMKDSSDGSTWSSISSGTLTNMPRVVLYR